MVNHVAPRLFVKDDLGIAKTILIGHKQAHYLKNVLRLKTGDALRLFNGREGEWRGAIGMVSKHALEIEIIEQSKPQTAEPDLWLCCAPIKKTHFDFLIEKATELGVSTIQPMLTARTQVREMNVERV